MALSRLQFSMSDLSPARMSRRIPRRLLCLLRRSLPSRYHLSLPFLLWIPGLHHHRQAKLSTFARTVPPLPSTKPLHQGNSDVRTLHPRLRHNCLMDPLLLPFLAPLLTPLRRLLSLPTIEATVSSPSPYSIFPQLFLVSLLLVHILLPP